MPVSVHLLAIDPQNDFCDLPPGAGPPDGAGAFVAPSLPVPGADSDLRRLAAFVRSAGAALTGLTVTLDSHHRLDVAHPGFWSREDGSPMDPFTQITSRDLKAGAFRPRREEDADRTLRYVEQLEARGRYVLMVWPVHCEIGSWGHGVHGELRAAYNEWEERTQRSVGKVLKGQNRFTEHYSALLAEVPDPADPGTQLNEALLAELDVADRIVVAGEAGSHCVKATVEDLVAHLPSGRPERIVLLTDCISPVAGFEGAQADFFVAMRGLGVRLTDSVTFAAEVHS